MFSVSVLQSKLYTYLQTSAQREGIWNVCSTVGQMAAQFSLLSFYHPNAMMMTWGWINQQMAKCGNYALGHASHTKFTLQMMLRLFNILAGLQHVRIIRKVFNVLFSTVLHSWEEHYVLPSDKWLVRLIRSGIWDSWNALTFSSNRFCLCSQIISGWSFLYDN